MTTEYTFAQLTEDYAAIRDLIEAKEAEIKPLKKIAEKVGEALLAKMNELDMKSAKAKSGARVDTVKSLSTKVEDREAWMNFVFEQGDDTFITNHVAKEAVELYMDDHEGEAPPGIKVESMISLRFTKAK